MVIPVLLVCLTSVRWLVVFLFVSLAVLFFFLVYHNDMEKSIVCVKSGLRGKVGKDVRKQCKDVRKRVFWNLTGKHLGSG